MQHERVLRGHQQAVEVPHPSRPSSTRSSSWAPRCESRLAQDGGAGGEEAAVRRGGHNTVYEARKKHQSVRRARMATERRTGSPSARPPSSSAQARERRATVRARAGCRDYAAQVSGTRPGVREEGAALFKRCGPRRRKRPGRRRERRARDAGPAGCIPAGSGGVPVKVSNMPVPLSPGNPCRAEEARSGGATSKAGAGTGNEEERDQQLKESKKMLHDEIHEWNAMSIMRHGPAPSAVHVVSQAWPYRMGRITHTHSLIIECKHTQRAPGRDARA